MCEITSYMVSVATKRGISVTVDLIKNFMYHYRIRIVIVFVSLSYSYRYRIRIVIVFVSLSYRDTIHNTQ